MSNPEWTPGPWRAERGNAGSFHPLFVVAPGQNGILPWKDEDAHLIAAARELYDALFMLSNARNFLGKRLIDNLGTGDREEIERALAKARGESQ